MKNYDFFKIPKYDGTGIYGIVCWEDMRIYVGSSENIKQRAYQHRAELKSNRHVNKELQEAFNKDRVLRFIILNKMDDVDKEFLLNMEYFYMYEAQKLGFNLYNAMPKSKNCDFERNLMWHILLHFDLKYSVSDNIESSISEMYNMSISEMGRTSYRECDAKRQMGKDPYEVEDADKSANKPITKKINFDKYKGVVIPYKKSDIKPLPIIDRKEGTRLSIEQRIARTIAWRNRVKSDNEKFSKLSLEKINASIEKYGKQIIENDTLKKQIIEFYGETNYEHIVAEMKHKRMLR